MNVNERDNRCTRCGETFANCYSAWSCDENLRKANAHLDNPAARFKDDDK